MPYTLQDALIRISDCLEGFDLEQIHAYLDSQGEEWLIDFDNEVRIPTVYDLERYSRGLLSDALDHPGQSQEEGGLRAFYDEEEDKLTIEYILTWSEA